MSREVALRVKQGLILFYLSRGHSVEESNDFATRHLAGESGFIANEPPAQIPQAAVDFKKENKL